MEISSEKKWIGLRSSYGKVTKYAVNWRTERYTCKKKS